LTIRIEAGVAAGCSGGAGVSTRAAVHPLAACALKRYAARVRVEIKVWVAVASALVGGCVSAGGENVLDSDCHVTWLDDGVMMTASTGNATWASKGGRDSVDVLGFKHSTGVEIYVAMPTPFTSQTFVCGQTTTDQSLLLTYRNNDPAGPAITPESCTVGFTQSGPVGESVTGTFEVVFDLPSGGTKSITNGSFDVSLSM
jgi:hypothetical protein